MKHLKLYGLQRTCTNIAAYLVEANFQAVRVVHGVEGKWKHGTPRDLGFDGYLCCMKGPFAWIASIRRYRPAALSELVRRWNEYNALLLEFASHHPALLVRHEALVSDWRNVLDEVATAFGLQVDTFPYVGQPNTMLRGGDAMRGADAVGAAAFRRRYYEEEEYLREFDEGQRGLVLRKLNRPLVRALGYEEVLT